MPLYIRIQTVGLEEGESSSAIAFSVVEFAGMLNQTAIPTFPFPPLAPPAIVDQSWLKVPLALS